METFSALLAICAGNSPVTCEFPAQRPVTRSFDVFFDLRLNNQLSTQWWGWWFETPSRPLWRHSNEFGLRLQLPDLCHFCCTTNRNTSMVCGYSLIMLAWRSIGAHPKAWQRFNIERVSGEFLKEIHVAQMILTQLWQIRVNYVKWLHLDSDDESNIGLWKIVLSTHVHEVFKCFSSLLSPLKSSKNELPLSHSSKNW